MGGVLLAILFFVFGVGKMEEGFGGTCWTYSDEATCEADSGCSWYTVTKNGLALRGSCKKA
jgi:hypothetical protein